MTYNNPSNCTELREAIAVRRPFMSEHERIRGDYIAVLSTTPANLSGPLAERVAASQRDLTEQYLTGGGRTVHPGHVDYYVSTLDGYVLGYIAHNGDHVIAPATEPSTATLDAVHAGLKHAEGDGSQPKISHAARDYGMHEPGHTDGEGVTFLLWERDPRTAVQSATVTATFTDRHTAYEAMRAADRLGLSVPADQRNHAWITRAASADDHAPTWGEQSA